MALRVICAALIYGLLLARAAFGQTPGPSATQALAAWASVPAAGAQLRVKEGSASAWISKDFQRGAQSFHVRLVRTQLIDVNGEPETCRACSADIGAVTYQQSNGKWHVISRQKNIAKLGTWGKVPENPKITMIHLAPDVPALSIQISESLQGTTYSSEEVFGFVDQGWRHLASIPVSADNSGNCEPSAARRALEGMPACWRFTGSVAAIARSSGLADLVVRRSGTQAGQDAESVAGVTNLRFVHRNGQYVEQSEQITDGRNAHPMERPAIGPAHQVAFERLYARTSQCMVSATRSMLQLGEHRQERILTFSLSTCAGPLRTLMTSQLAMTGQHSDAFLSAMADDALRRTLGR